MRTLFAAIACIVGFVAWANDGRIQSQTLEVKDRLMAIEQLNVTAKKEADESVPVDEEVAAILAEAQAAED